MQTTSALYKTLLASKNARREVRILIECGDPLDDSLLDSSFEHILDSSGNTIGTYISYNGQFVCGEEDILEARTDGALFSESTLSFGGCVSREFVLRFFPHELNIPRMARLEPQVRLRDGDVVSEWIPKGVFYIDTRETDRNSGVLTLTGYDAMLKAEAEYISPGDVGVWPLPMSVVASEICSMMGLEMDSRTRITDYPVELPTGYSMREVLSAIAAANAGNWIITDDGKLRLVRIDETRDTVNLGRRAMNCSMSAPFEPITHVVVNLDEEVYAEAGDDTGRTLEVTCPWGTEGMAAAILSSLSGFIYRPYTAGGAILDPAAELGDAILLDGVSGILAAQTIRFNALFASDISSPGEDEIDHEYPYHSTSQREIKRRLKTITTTFKVESERISGEITAVDGRVTKVEETIDGVSSRVEGVADNAVSSVSVYYALSDSESVAPVSGWSVVAPGWENGKFMWQKTVTVYGDGREVTSDPTCISGARGASQEAGYSTAIVYLYRRSLKAVTAITWDDTLTYHFPTQKLLSVPDGWSETIPSGDEPLYVTAATAYANTGSDAIAPGEWSKPVLLVKNGENGAGVQSVVVSYGVSSAWNQRPTKWVSDMPEVEPGDYLWTKTVTTYADPEIPETVIYTQTRQGEDGVRGADGMNSAVVYLYKRFDYAAWYGTILDYSELSVLDSEGNPLETPEIEVPPSIDWTETLTYDFLTRKLSEIPEGWSDVPPEGNEPVFLVTASVSSYDTTGNIPASDWSAPVLFWRNGKDGVDGQPGKDGEDGRPGRDGVDGTSSYIHIKYAPVPNPTDTQITDIPSEYIGICVTTSAPDPTEASRYTWTKWEGHDGPQGIPGTNGKDGTAEYVHFAYSTSADGKQNFSVTSFPGATYIGVCHDDKVNDPTTPASYEWTLIKGADGAKGDKGADGANGTNAATVFLYQRKAGTSPVKPTNTLTYTFSSGELTPTTSLGSWTRTIPAANGNPCWVIQATAISTAATDNISNSEWSAPVILAENGLDGTDGVGVSSIVPEYYLSTSATSQAGGEWTTTCPDWAAGKYIWTRSHLYWEDGTETTTAPALNNAVNGLGQKYTEVKQTADKVEWLVVGDSSTTFTLSDRAAKLVSDTIDLTGFVTFTDLRTAGKTEISGSNIKTGTIDANEVTIKNINASNINSGTISADRISGGTIDASDVTIKNLDASKITTGELSASRISGGTLDFSEITVRNLSANAITTGTFSADRISGGTIDADSITVKNLSASNMTKGTLDASKVAVDNMNASNLKSGSIDAKTIPVTNISATNVNTGTLDASKLTVKNLSADSITSGTLDASKVTVKNLKADSIDTSGIKIKAVYGEGTYADTALISSDVSCLYIGKQTSGTQRISGVDICTYAVYFGYAGGRTLEVYTDTGSTSTYGLRICPKTDGTYYIGLPNKQFQAVYAKKIYIDGEEVKSNVNVTDIYAVNDKYEHITLNSSKQFIPYSSGYYLGNATKPFERLYLASNCYLSASSGKLAVNGTVIDTGGSGDKVSEIYVSGSTTAKITLNSSKDFIPSATGFSLGSTSYPFDEVYIGASSSYYWKITEAGIIPSRTTSTTSSYFNLGSSTYPVNVIRANKLYVNGKEVTGSDSGSSSTSTNYAGMEVRMGGTTSYYIVADTNRKLRPSSYSNTYPFYLGDSTYYWHYAYIGSNTVEIGSSASSKLGFFGTAAIAKQTLSTTSTNMNYTSATASNYLTILNNLVGILKNKYGLIA